MVEENIQSALVLEDDADWDIRIKAQMQDFARASRLLIQPQSNGEFLDPSYQQPEDGQKHKDFNIDEYVTGTPKTSPYGDLEHWDLLWLGHCGGRFPAPQDQDLPLGRVIIHDETVPESHFVDIQFGSNELTSEYPSHTRVVARAAVNTCMLGYALSLPGATRLLYELGVRQLVNTLDMEMRSFCEGSQGRSHGRCLTVHPQLFQHHRPVGNMSSFSDISDHGDKLNEHAFTKNIRWSARMNLLKMIDGRTDYDDQFPDGGELNSNIPNY